MKRNSDKLSRYSIYDAGISIQCSLIIVDSRFFIFVTAIKNAVENKLDVRSPFPLYVIELDERATGGGRIGEIVRHTRGGRARKRKAELAVNRTNGELLGSRFHSTSTRLRNPLHVPPSDYHCDPHPRLPR